MTVELKRSFYDPTFILEIGGSKECSACQEPFNTLGRRPVLHDKVSKVARHAIVCEACFPDYRKVLTRKIDGSRIEYLKCTLCDVKCHNGAPLENPPAKRSEIVFKKMDNDLSSFSKELNQFICLLFFFAVTLSGYLYQERGT